MRTRILVAATATAGAVAAITIGVPSASAATRTLPHLVGSAAGSTVSVVGGTVTSGPTAASGLNTLSAGHASTNDTVKTLVPGVLGVGAVRSSVTTTAVRRGTSVTSRAKSGGVNIAGVVVARAIYTRAIATSASGSVRGSVTTGFTGLMVGGTTVHTPVAPNTVLEVPGVARVRLNAQHVTGSDDALAATGGAIVVTLLSGELQSTVVVNPVSASVGRVGTGYAPLGGNAYATQILAVVDGSAAVLSGPTAAVEMPADGTHGTPLRNNTATVVVPGVARIGAVASSANGIVRNTNSRSILRTTVGGASLFGGMIKLGAVTATAGISIRSGHRPAPYGQATIARLTVNGQRIPAAVAPNTVIQLPGLGRLVLNNQRQSSTGSFVRALDLLLTTATDGLPVGAEIQIGTAIASFTR